MQDELYKFKQQLLNPDHVLITATRARNEFGLTRKHLGKMKPVEKNTDERGVEEQYWLPDVISLARHLSSDDMITDRYRHYIESGRERKYRRSKIYGMNQKGKEEGSGWLESMVLVRKVGAEMGMRGRGADGADVVLLSVAQNTAITATKLGVWSFTGSSAVFADAMHSVADVVNGVYRFVGVNLANRDPDLRHPYGYMRLRYVFTDRSSVVLLGLGGLVPLYHGVNAMRHAHEISSPIMMAALFTTVGILETPALMRAYGELKEKAKKARMPVYLYLWRGSDMINITTLTECCLGVLASAAGVFGSFQMYMYGDPWYDAAASVFIASTVILGSSALLVKTAKALVGETLPVHTVDYVIYRLEQDPVVYSVHDVKTEVLGVDTVRFKAEIEFNAEAITRKLMNLHELPSPESAKLLDAVSQLDTEHRAEDWLMKNNAMYQTALSMELDRIERLVRELLSESNFRHFYIDMELW